MFKKLFTEFLNTEEVKRFETANAVTPQRRRALTFGAVLMFSNREPLRTFKMMHAGPGQIESLRTGFGEWWGIYDEDEALEVLEYLSKAEGHAPFANQLYQQHIAPKRKDKRFGVRDENTGNQRADQGLKAYDQVWYDLQRFPGKDHKYASEELLAVENFAAWDLGRVVYIARNSVALGYLEEERVWQYIEKAADMASGIYSGWREYLAAYCLGRALGYGSYKNIDLEVKYLLKDDNSPYKDSKFK
ncbi:MAG: DUF1266 domain-containing protein [Defluviitaleaceae bacterium]|nr:DUF1266 domain-containing protein [Defluviitaleaceae bacterium]